MSRHTLRHPQDLGPLGLPSHSAFWCNDSQARQFERITAMHRKMGLRLGKARSLALLHPEGFVLDVVQRGQTLDVVLDDFRASWLLGHFGFSGEARWTLSFKKCERVEWLIEEVNYRGKTRSRLRPATMQEVISSRWREAKTWSDFECSTGIHLNEGWVLNRRQPLQWAARLAAFGSNYLVVTCDRAVVIDQREEAMRRIGGREMAELWRRYLEDATMFGYPFPPEWVMKQGDSPLKGGRPGGASK